MAYQRKQYKICIKFESSETFIPVTLKTKDVDKILNTPSVTEVTNKNGDFIKATRSDGTVLIAKEFLI